MRGVCWWSTGIQGWTKTLATVNVEVAQARETLAGIEEATRGMTLWEIEGERFVVLSASTLDYPPLTLRGRVAVMLSRKRRSCLTELEQQLTAASEKLSGQYEMEQRRRAEQVEALRQQVERLSRHMTRLAAN